MELFPLENLLCSLNISFVVFEPFGRNKTYKVYCFDQFSDTYTLQKKGNALGFTQTHSVDH